ncbi:MAG: Asp-tRNA(Asn)/Glu-tRNA(Gln) amidotransferase subunit GatB [Chloroflexi bacterium]|nr:Asp-tRNA(Asn)/Glu-tRNA(Gln) amidotransferase subunit GatB [Chloroflexota bacterium]MDA1240272.1 Asp-tRNA(Asn)/Glu-tRNA(Gln) amidotransferase subunit GatB [Chloroflexota bacterium]MQC19214.1 Asp-tRNA(Asn)/Glu-tRNA(Gln) amidotransferase subunit GatB [Chloroflexota bacterium]
MTTAAATDYEAVIGVEVHIQLKTRSKMFCGCDREYFDTVPNSHVCPVCLGMPGMLPVINRQAVEYTMLAGLALGCEIPHFAKFDRKNYPYPDLMKGYQISQYDQPFCLGGSLEIEVGGRHQTVALERIHLEEDTARLLHRDAGGEAYALVDVNRSGSPLMELVTTPDMHSGAEAAAFLRTLRQVMRYLGIADADMEKGGMRCDANVSIRPRGVTTLGTKVEVKNMNSFRSVQRAIEFEIERQTKVLDAGGTLVQETRGYVDATGETVSQRSKEQAHDYRYFPEPDLPPIIVDDATIEALRARMPELPVARRTRFEGEYGLTADESRTLTDSRERSDAYEAAVQAAGTALARPVALWFIGDVARHLNELSVDAELTDTKATPAHIGELVRLVHEGAITQSTAKDVLGVVFEIGDAPRAIVEARGLGVVRDEGAIEALVAAAIEANPKAVADYQGGKASVAGFLVGQVMREAKGRADVATVTELIKQRLGG